eukprot:11173600-Lingulodinium_polyedra.AAC.1
MQMDIAQIKRNCKTGARLPVWLADLVKLSVPGHEEEGSAMALEGHVPRKALLRRRTSCTSTDETDTVYYEEETIAAAVGAGGEDQPEGPCFWDSS